MRKVKFFKAQIYSLFMLIILCFDKSLKISTVYAVDDLFTNVNKSSTALTVDIFKPVSKHKMININREYV